MSKSLKHFSFPFTTAILILSAVMIFLPTIIVSFLGADAIIKIPVTLSKMTLLFSSLFAALGFIYCTLGYHVKIARGDELKFRIHLESLHVTFTSTLVSLFILIFVFINFSPMMLNWILVLLSIIAIITYLIASLLIQDRYQ
ncbi:MAG: hypothetical protein ACM3MI_06660 [Clostridiales bacterium]